MFQVFDLLDGVDLDSFYERTVTVDGDFNITGHPIFAHLTLKRDLNITKGNLIDGVDIFHLNDNAFRVDRKQTILGKFPSEVSNF